MGQKDSVLPIGELEQFCIDELIINAVRIRYRLGDIGDFQTESNPARSPADLENVLEDLRKLESSTRKVAQSLQHCAKEAQTKAENIVPRVPDDPVEQKPFLTIENVLSKCVARRAQQT